MKTYIARVFKDPNSSFGVTFPDLPGCYGAGDSYDEAIENAKISLREYAQTLADDGDDMPHPRSHSELTADASEEIEFKAAAFIIEVPLFTVGSKRRVNLSLDDRVLAGIDRACELAGLNRSAFIAHLAMNWMQETMNAVVAPAAKKCVPKRKKLTAA
jgi:predicted RNase H-like HicB family nuclease